MCSQNFPSALRFFLWLTGWNRQLLPTLGFLFCYSYVGARASHAFRQPFVQYMQANLVYPDRVKAAFTPPTGHPPFDIVIDFTGEVRINRNDDVSLPSRLRSLPLMLRGFPSLRSRDFCVALALGRLCLSCPLSLRHFIAIAIQPVVPSAGDVCGPRGFSPACCVPGPLGRQTEYDDLIDCPVVHARGKHKPQATSKCFMPSLETSFRLLAPCRRLSIQPWKNVF